MPASFKKYDVVMLSMSDWHEWFDEGIVNRNYHILQGLKKRPEIGRIFHIDYLPYDFRRALKSYLKNQLFYKSGNLICSRMTSKLYEEGPDIYHYTTVDSAIGGKRASKNINRIIERLGFKNILLWSYLPIRVEAFANINADIRIFDAVDNWAQHPGYRNIKKRIEDNYEEIKNIADIIFTVSKDMEDKLSGNNNIHWIPNGVDVNHFRIESRIKNQELRKLAKGRSVIGYIGIIQKRLDVEIIKTIAEKNKDKLFLFVGMVWPDAGVDKLKNLPNVKFIGQKKYQELPKYINAFDVAIIPHKIDKFTKSMNPLKLYEYLACGKPVVTTGVAGVEEFSNMIYIAESAEEFSEKIGQALQEDNERKSLSRKEEAEKHSWDKRIDKIMDIIINR